MSRILVIDDDFALGLFIQDALEDEGYTILRVLNGAEAFIQLTTFQPQLILCDFIMPEMNGLEFCTRLQADPTLAHIPVVLCSARRDGRSMGAGPFVAVLNKPFTVEQLLTTVQRTLLSARL